VAVATWPTASCQDRAMHRVEDTLPNPSKTRQDLYALDATNMTAIWQAAGKSFFCSVGFLTRRAAAVPIDSVSVSGCLCEMATEGVGAE